ncbi:MAG: hypothetical protein CMJ94_09700 [Planctomycetes bacterium]|nr:hypothetical protein [Planctomycetota bacterium]
MKLALHLLGALCVTAALVRLAFFPAPAAPVDELAPLWGPEAETQESVLNAVERSAVLQEELHRAFPPGGGLVRNQFGDASQAAAPAFAGFPALHAPQDLRASAQEGGVRLSWRAHPQNPVEGLVYRVERWNAAGELEADWVQEGLERLDLLPCEGIPYAYRVAAQLSRELELGGETQELIRRSPSARTSVRLERRTSWEARESADGRLLLTLKRPGSPDEGPFEAIPGQALGGSGWIVESWTKGETEVQHLARTPRFDELGRRIVIDGRPASRVREEPRMRAFVTLSLLDPCGYPLRENLFLGEEAPR